MVEKEPVFKDLEADTNAPTEVESLCMACEENGEQNNGTTKILLTRIPHYKEVILMSFNCNYCGYQNNEIQSGGMVQEMGVSYTLKLTEAADLSRQLVKSDYASLSVPEIELEIPPNSQKGTITTIEGVLKRTIAGLTQDQPVRKHLDPEGARQIDAYVAKIEDLIASANFTIVLSDPSGNSFVENPHAPRSDPHRTVSHFARSREQDHALGLYTAEEIAGEETAASEAAESTASATSSTLLLGCEEGEIPAEAVEKAASEATGMLALPRVLSASETTAASEKQQPVEEDDLTNEVLTFNTNCPECGAPAETKMKLTSIPHFKEVVIMATVCEYCGHKTNEVKSGGGIEAKGKKITLRVTDPTDLSRDVLKSETCAIAIPELEFEMGGYAIGGRFTTLEGLMNNILEQVDNNPLFGAAVGDSASDGQKIKVENFKADLKAMMEVRKPFTVILDDPAGNSYIQNVYAPDPDPELETDLYTRSYDQDEDLGLNDMKTENYETDPVGTQA